MVEFADFGEDLGQPIGELIEAMAGWAVRQRATEHLNSVLREQERIYSTFQACARRDDRRLLLRDQVAWLRAGQVELTLQVITDDENVLHGHFRFDVAKQRHKRRQTDAGRAPIQWHMCDDYSGPGVVGTIPAPE